jgi:hypothetical protein
VLPKGFQRIRHYGFLANCCRQRKLTLCRQLLRMAPPEPKSPPPRTIGSGTRNSPGVR